ncbi:hypothetical protein PoB_004957800 [Plakobranchus ocellatus]|uniref:Uncharacterized protein n=1 Tax=Plakobranchus ocellatus TaxID=259542 RepID=A0AAV4BV47_9GAST|nr:hypothetical protein PoB_004957800 [Plakobranchus ocellatus]
MLCKDLIHDNVDNLAVSPQNLICWSYLGPKPGTKPRQLTPHDPCTIRQFPPPPYLAPRASTSGLAELALWLSVDLATDIIFLPTLARAERSTPHDDYNAAEDRDISLMRSTAKLSGTKGASEIVQLTLISAHQRSCNGKCAKTLRPTKQRKCAISTKPQRRYADDVK